LTMARYCPSAYREDQEIDESQVALVGLVRSGLLKRFESSVHAFALTAERIVDSHNAFLAALEKGYLLTPKALEEWANVDSDEEWEQLLQKTGAESAEGYDVERLCKDVENDRDILRKFAGRAQKVKAKTCPKLAEFALRRLPTNLAEL